MNSANYLSIAISITPSRLNIPPLTHSHPLLFNTALESTWSLEQFFNTRGIKTQLFFSAYSFSTRCFTWNNLDQFNHNRTLHHHSLKLAISTQHLDNLNKYKKKVPSSPSFLQRILQRFSLKSPPFALLPVFLGLIHRCFTWNIHSVNIKGASFIVVLLGIKSFVPRET